MSQYFARIGNKTVGPINLPQVQKLIDAGHIHSKTQMSHNNVDFMDAELILQTNSGRDKQTPTKNVSFTAQTVNCPCCAGPISAKAEVCPRCNFNISQYASEQKQSNEEQTTNFNVLGTFLDRAPGARKISEKSGLDFDLKKLNLAGISLVAITCIASLVIVIVVMRLAVPRDSSRALIRIVGFAAAIFPAFILFWLGRFLLSLFGIRILKD